MDQHPCKFLVIGAGAIGGFIGGCLSRDPLNSVYLVARGEHYKAMKDNGLRLTINANNTEANEKREDILLTNLTICNSIQEISTPMNVIFLTVKYHQLISIARDPYWKKLLKADTRIVVVQNGIPWYIFLKREKGALLSQTRLKSVDPTGELEANFDTDRVIGCIAMPACKISNPGFVVHEHGWALPMSESPQFLINRLNKVGFRANNCSKEFECELWVKSLGSAVFNPISALTGCRLLCFAKEPYKNLTMQAMNEVRSVALACGIDLKMSNEKRLQGAVRIGYHKTSMLQDVEAGKVELETDAILGSIIEIANLTQTPVPTLQILYHLIKMKQEVLQSKCK